MKFYLHSKHLRVNDHSINIHSMGTERYLRKVARNSYRYSRKRLRLTCESSRIYTLGALMSMHITRKVDQ